MQCRKNLKNKKKKLRIKVFVLIIFSLYFQSVYAECMKIEPNSSNLEESTQEDILKEARQYLSEKQISDILGFGKEMNKYMSEINTFGSCQRSGISEQDGVLDAISEHHSSPTSNQSSAQSKPELFVFVSNSMPEESLKQWSQQVERAGGTLMLRGFIDNSPKRTVERVMELFGKEDTSGFSIDPERFEQMGIHKVPAVAIMIPKDKSCKGEDCPKPLFEVVYGDVPLDDALSVIATRNPDKVGEAASGFLERYRKGQG